jgi:hypothetical protein
VGLAGALVSLVGKSMWAVVMHHTAVDMDADTAGWMEAERAKVNATLAVTAARRQLARTKAQAGREAVALAGTGTTEWEAHWGSDPDGHLIPKEAMAGVIGDEQDEMDRAVPVPVPVLSRDVPVPAPVPVPVPAPAPVAEVISAPVAAVPAPVPVQPRDVPVPAPVQDRAAADRVRDLISQGITKAPDIGRALAREGLTVEPSYVRRIIRKANGTEIKS